MRRFLNLQMFAEGDSGGDGDQVNAGNGNNNQSNQGNTGSGQGGGFTHAQLEEIANARADRAERSALASFFRKEGMTEAEITQAINQFKEDKKKNQPNTSEIEKQRDEALKKISRFENEKVLSGMHVTADDMDYVSFKVAKMVTDKKDFKTCADEFLKANPRYASGGQGTYRVSVGAANTGQGAAEKKNATINDFIRNSVRGR